MFVILLLPLVCFSPKYESLNSFLYYQELRCKITSQRNGFLDVVWPVNSVFNACELALRVARNKEGQGDSFSFLTFFLREEPARRQRFYIRHLFRF